jgi:uncharacterized protein with HEPN domain
MRDAIDRVLTYTSGGREAFFADRKTQDAVVRNLEVLGEAAKNVAGPVKDAHPNIPWKRIAGMRDKLIHEYFGVDLALVWEVVEREIVPLRDRLSALLERLEEHS